MKKYEKHVKENPYSDNLDTHEAIEQSDDDVSLFSLLSTCGKKRGVPKVRRYVLNDKSDKNRQRKVQFYEKFR